MKFIENVVELKDFYFFLEILRKLFEQRMTGSMSLDFLVSLIFTVYLVVLHIVGCYHILKLQLFKSKDAQSIIVATQIGLNILSFTVGSLPYALDNSDWMACLVLDSLSAFALLAVLWLTRWFFGKSLERILGSIVDMRLLQLAYWPVPLLFLVQLIMSIYDMIDIKYHGLRISGSEQVCNPGYYPSSDATTLFTALSNILMDLYQILLFIKAFRSIKDKGKQRRGMVVCACAMAVAVSGTIAAALGTIIQDLSNTFFSIGLLLSMVSPAVPLYFKSISEMRHTTYSKSYSTPGSITVK